jgi:hypothetical protein
VIAPACAHGVALNPARFLLVFGVDAAAWATRYDIVPFTVACPDCGATQSTTITFVYRRLRGLVASSCGCGSESTPYCVVPAPDAGDLLTGIAALGPSRRASRQTVDPARPE